VDWKQAAVSASTLVFVVSSMLGMGLGLTVGQIVAPLRNVRLVILSLVANFVVMPLVAVGLARILGLDQALGIGLRRLRREWRVRSRENTGGPRSIARPVSRAGPDLEAARSVAVRPEHRVRARARRRRRVPARCPACFWHGFFVAVGVPALTTVLCEFDSNWFSAIDPGRHGLRFERKTTVGHGGTHCPFHFFRVPASKS
jgi:hypothetical protein